SVIIAPTRRPANRQAGSVGSGHESRMGQVERDCEFSCSEMDGTILAVVALEKFHAEMAACGSFGDGYPSTWLCRHSRSGVGSGPQPSGLASSRNRWLRPGCIFH